MADIGVKFAIDGEAAFKNALKNINQQSKELASEMKMVTAKLDENASSQEKAAAKAGTLQKQYDNQAKAVELLRDKYDSQKAKLAELADALEKATTQYGADSDEAKKAAKEYQSFETQTSKTKTELNNAEAALANTGKALQENDKALKDNEKSTKSNGEAWKKFGSTMSSVAKGIAGAVAGIAAAATAAGKAIWDTANETAAAGDEIDKMSQKIGVSTDAYQEWSYVFARSGTDVNNLQAGMKTLSGVIADAAAGSETAAEKLSAVGLSMEQLNGLSQEDQLALVISSLQEMGTGAERTAAATDLLGKSATDMAAVLNMTAEDTQALKDEAHEYGMVMSNDAVKASADFEDSLERMKRTLGGVKNGIMGDVLPSITSLMDGISLLVTGNDEGMLKIQEGLDGLLANVNNIIPQLTGVITTIANAILEAAPQIITSLADGIIQAIPELLPTVVLVISSLVNSLVELLPQLIDVGVQLLFALVDGFMDALPQLIPAAKEALSTIVNKLTDPDAIGNMIETALELITYLGQGLINAIPVLIERIPTIISNIVTGILTHLPEIIQCGLDLLGSLFNNLPAIINNLIRGVAQVLAAIFNALKEKMGDFKEIGSNMIKGIWNGITNVVSWLKNKLKGWVKDTLSYIKSLFGIHSPSKEFANIAKMNVLGLAKGFKDNAKTAYSALADMKGGLMDTWGSGLTLSGRLGGATASVGRTTNLGGVNINVYAHEGQDANSIAEAVMVKIQNAVAGREAVWA